MAMKKKPGKSGKTHRMPDGRIMKGAKHERTESKSERMKEYGKAGKKRG